MKLIHLSDLHLGKRVNEFSMLDDQAYILEQILEIIDAEQPRGVLIAGDVYDKSVPQAEAVALFDDFLYRLSERRLEVFVISGNHDSAERVAFGGRLMDRSGVHMAPVYDGQIAPVELRDGDCAADIFMLPFIKPTHVRRCYPDEKIESYTDALGAAIAHMPIDPARINLLLAHQFVTGAARCDSEETTVGGLDGVSADVFDAFDYVALGHLHGPQNLGGGRLRYCGTPLKYSLSEAGQAKSVTVVEIGGKRDIRTRTVALKPRHELRRLRGSYLELSARRNYEGSATDDYLFVTLTDEQDIPDGMAKLRVIYPNLMQLSYDNTRTRENRRVEGANDAERKSELELFEEFYENQNNQPIDAAQRDYLKKLIEEIREGAQ